MEHVVLEPADEGSDETVRDNPQVKKVKRKRDISTAVVDSEVCLYCECHC